MTEMTPTERGIRLGWLLGQGEPLTVDQVARDVYDADLEDLPSAERKNLRRRVLRILSLAGRVLAVTDADGHWKVTNS